MQAAQTSGQRLGFYAITAYFNPCNYKSRYDLYLRFREHMRDIGIDLITVECALGERPFAMTRPNRKRDVQVRSVSVLFIKELLLNIDIALSKLPDDARYVAWIDCNLTFIQPDLADDIVS